MRALPLLGFVGLFGCGGATSAAKVEAPTGPAPKRAPRSAIVFVSVYEGLLPVACFDAPKKAWRTGKACLDLLSLEDEVRLERDQRVVKLTGHRTPTITGCTLETKLPMFDDAKGEKPGSIAVWPANDPARFHRIGWGATQKGSADLKPEERDALARGMAKVGPVSGVSVVQAASADLDDDGQSELVVSATTTSFHPGKKAGGFAALLVHGPGQKEMAVVRSSDHAVFRAEGTIDLDDDGLPELVFSERTAHPNGQRSDSYALAHWSGSAVAALPPVESCWPPIKDPPDPE